MVGQGAPPQLSLESTILHISCLLGKVFSAWSRQRSFIVATESSVQERNWPSQLHVEIRGPRNITLGEFSPSFPWSILKAFIQKLSKNLKNISSLSSFPYFPSFILTVFLSSCLPSFFPPLFFLSPSILSSIIPFFFFHENHKFRGPQIIEKLNTQGQARFWRLTSVNAITQES